MPSYRSSSKTIVSRILFILQPATTIIFVLKATTFVFGELKKINSLQVSNMRISGSPPSIRGMIFSFPCWISIFTMKDIMASKEEYVVAICGMQSQVDYGLCCVLYFQQVISNHPLLFSCSLLPSPLSFCFPFLSRSFV